MSLDNLKELVQNTNLEGLEDVGKDIIQKVVSASSAIYDKCQVIEGALPVKINSCLLEDHRVDISQKCVLENHSIPFKYCPSAPTPPEGFTPTDFEYKLTDTCTNKQAKSLCEPVLEEISTISKYPAKPWDIIVANNI